MTTYTAITLVLMAISGPAQLWAKMALVLCAFLGAGIQYAVLYRCKRFGRWLFPLMLAVLWLMLELAGQMTVNFAQFSVLAAIMAVICCSLGAVLGWGICLVRTAVQRKSKAAQ